MAQKIVAETDKFLLALLKSRGVKVQRILLFGSLSRGRRNKNRDIDLIVVSEDFHGRDIFQRLAKTKGIHRELVKRFRMPFDILYYSPSEWEESRSPIVMHAKTQGKIIFQSY